MKYFSAKKYYNSRPIYTPYQKKYYPYRKRGFAYNYDYDLDTYTPNDQSYDDDEYQLVKKEYFNESFDDSEKENSTKKINSAEIKEHSENSLRTAEPTAGTSIPKQKESKESISFSHKSSECSFESNEIQSVSNFEYEDKPSDSSSPSGPMPLLNVSEELIDKANFVPKKVKNIYNFLWLTMQRRYNYYIKTQKRYEESLMKPLPPTQEYAPSVSEFSFKENYENAFSPNDSSSYFGLNNIMIGDHLSKELPDNTEILRVVIKINKEKELVFKIRRFDDMFKTVKMFCEINQLDEKYIRPISMMVIKALNGIYKYFNMTLTDRDVEILNGIKYKHNTMIE